MCPRCTVEGGGVKPPSRLCRFKLGKDGAGDSEMQKSFDSADFKEGAAHFVEKRARRISRAGSCGGGNEKGAGVAPRAFCFVAGVPQKVTSTPARASMPGATKPLAGS